MAVSALGVSLICSQICVEGRHFSFLLCNIYPLGLSPVLGWREFALEFPHMCMWEENVYPLTFGGRTKIHPLSLTCGEILPTLDMFSNAWEGGYSNTVVIRVKADRVKGHKMEQSESLVQDMHSPKCLDASCSVVPHIPNLRDGKERQDHLETASTSLHDQT